ncbi:PTS sugar transporter subunit IIB [Virgibacillus necropolis]|uniref:PTS ascorbate transporter subunit IIB n=1 Tax=Virgibacillus necropolis TaxID=163877 RepID=A0A221M9K4_9BACI|nr:PTS sugar transporter subunit IIB [Virgibacillus necropolis]ASN04301.1 PTS ascorbate transporter subunit IIB [Virgibacillus necropolis]
MKEALVACRTGMGSSMMLKIKVEQVVRENNYPIKVHHDTLSAVNQFKGDLLITLEDLVPDVKDKVKYVIGIKNLMDKEEIKSKLNEFLEVNV